MRCKNCNKIIDEYEIFCDDCKKELKKSATRSDIKELERLISDSNINRLDDTIELNDLSSLTQNENLSTLENTQVVDTTISDDKAEDVKVTREEKNEDILNTDNENSELKMTREEKNLTNIAIKKAKSKKVIIIITIIMALLVALFIFLILNRTPESDKRVEVLDYEKIINDYGEKVSSIVTDYKDKNSSVPTWEEVLELLEYDKYNVECEIHYIYQDGTIYLNSCEVNDKKVRYSYGKEQDEQKNGKKIDIYKDSNGYNNESNGTLVSSITCNSDDCEFVTALDKYVIVTESGSYYLYNYDNDTLEFGPFNLDQNYYNNFIMHDGILYGIYYSESNTHNIYSIKASKVFKNISGELESDYNLMLKYGYVVFKLNNSHNFINMKTGNISYKIENNIGKFIEDKKNNIVYITSYLNNINKFKLYNSNGKLLFDGEEFSNVSLYDEGLMVSTDKSFKLYDSKLNLKIKSKDYELLLGIYDKLIVVLDNQSLNLVNINDKLITVLFDKYDKYSFNFLSESSGYETIDNNKILHILLENKSIPTSEDGHIIKISYNLKTEEVKLEETH